MPRIALVANDGWNVLNFRAGLIRDLIAHGCEIAVVAPDGPYSNRIRALGATFLPVKLDPRGQSPLADLGLLWRYRRLLGTLAPDAMFGYTAKPNIWGSIAARSLSIPVINNISGLGTAFIQGGRLEKLVSGLYRLALAGSATVFFQNEDDQALFVKRGLVRPAQARLLPGSGVNLDHFATAPLPANRRFTFVLPARLIWDKGIREYADAARILRQKGSDARFQLLGKIEPPTAQSVPESEIRAWERDGLIDYLGMVDDVRPVFSAADCIVLPSYREGTPRSLLEAGAMGRPSVTTDVPGCRSVVEDGLTGLLCAAHSAPALAQAMEHMLDLRPARRRAMARAARKRIEQVFDERIVHRACREALSSSISLCLHDVQEKTATRR